MSFEKQNCVYILASLSGTLYIGITNNLERRMVEHKEGLVSGFTKQYGVYRTWPEHGARVGVLRLARQNRARSLRMTEAE